MGLNVTYDRTAPRPDVAVCLISPRAWESAGPVLKKYSHLPRTRGFDFVVLIP